MKDKEKRADVQYIVSTPLFYGMNRDIIWRDFLNYFVIKKVIKKDMIISSGDKSKFVFIIRQGDFSVSCSKSILELEEMIKALGGTVQEDPRVSFNLKKVK